MCFCRFKTQYHVRIELLENLFLHCIYSIHYYGKVVNFKCFLIVFKCRSDTGVGRKTLRNVSVKSQISFKTPVGKRTAHKYAIKDKTCDSQVYSYLPYRWSPANLTFNICFYLFLYLYITRIMVINGTPHQKSPKNQNRKATLGRPSIKLLGVFNKFVVDQPSPFVLSCFHRHLVVQFAWKIPSS